MKKTLIISISVITAIGKIYCQESINNIYDVIKKNQANSENKRQVKITASSGDLEEFVSKIKKLNINVDSADEVGELLGKPNSKYKLDGKEIWWYLFDNDGSQVHCQIWINTEKILICVKVIKVGSGEIYSKGNNSEVNSSKSLNNSNKLVVPGYSASNPTPGQIYFDTSDSHFYGWNGKEWIQLDNSKN